MVQRHRLPRAGAIYVALITAAGLAVVADSAYLLYVGSVSKLSQWFILAALTLLSGSATVRLPSVPATISISETFVFTSVLLFGPAAGALIVALDGLIISFWFVRRRREIHRVLFNMAAPALSIWLASSIYLQFPGIHPLSHGAIPLDKLIVPIAAFASTHFVLNSWFIAIAVAFETKRSPLSIWKDDFLWLSLNYLGGASVAALLVVYTQKVDWQYLGAIVPLLLLLYFTFKVPMARVEDANRHLKTLNSLYLSTIETLAMAIDAKDQVTHGHIRRVQSYAVGLAKELGVTDRGLLRAIEASALLHDMGKLAIPEHILNKPGRLSAAEFEKMKLHSAIGADLLSAIEFPYPVVPIVRHHHENWDGTGYPDGLRATQIPIAARILAVVDCFDALTSDRPYRPKLSDEDAAKILRERRGIMYDPLVVDTFLRVYAQLTPTEPQITSEQRQFIAHITELNQPETSSPDEDSNRVPVATSAEVQSLLRPLEALLEARLGACALVLSFYEEDADELRVGYVSVGAASELGTYVGRTLEIGQRLTGWVAATHRRILNSDAALDYPHGAATYRSRFRYCCALPLGHAENKILGVLTVYSQSLVNEPMASYFELVASRVTGELSRRGLHSGVADQYLLSDLARADQHEHVARVMTDAFGRCPVTLRWHLKNLQPSAIASDLLIEGGSLLTVADVVLVGDDDELYLVSPRTQDVSVQADEWLQSRFPGQAQATQVSDGSDRRLSA